jgi:hypothetical protein
MMETAWGAVWDDGSLLRDLDGPVLTDTRSRMRKALKGTKVKYPDLPMRLKVVKVRMELVTLPDD